MARGLQSEELRVSFFTGGAADKREDLCFVRTCFIIKQPHTHTEGRSFGSPQRQKGMSILQTFSDYFAAGNGDKIRAMGMAGTFRCVAGKV